jgi:hypothetical protein
MLKASISKPKKLSEMRAFQWTMIVIGWTFVVLAPIVSPLPGPMGLAFFVFGSTLILKNSLWAKRQYAKHSKRHPQYGEWFNWAMRRKRFRKRPPFPPAKRDLLALFGRMKKRAKLR